jgi:hypothetical protein
MDEQSQPPQELPQKQPSPSEPDPREAAYRKILGPAVALIVTAGIGMLLSLLSIAMSVFQVRLMSMIPARDESIEQALFSTPLFMGIFNIVPSLLGIGIGAVIIFGCVKMMRLENRGLAYAVCIMAMIPCVSPCCILGLPFGIWALVMLSDNDVKSAFQ